MRWLFAGGLLFTALSLAADPAKALERKSSKSLSSVRNANARSPRPRAKRARAARGASYQLHPDPERYREIQKALADRGYFKGQVNGQWDQDSVEALKRFQADQKLPDDGRIGALSLIALGLGPKHDANAAQPAHASTTAPAPIAEPPSLPSQETTPPDSSIAPPLPGPK